MREHKITAVWSVWIEHCGLQAYTVKVVAGNSTTALVAHAQDGRWIVERTAGTIAEAERQMKTQARAEGMMLVECRGSLETALHSMALHEPWVEFLEVAYA